MTTTPDSDFLQSGRKVYVFWVEKLFRHDPALCLDLLSTRYKLLITDWALDPDIDLADPRHQDLQFLRGMGIGGIGRLWELSEHNPLFLMPISPI